MLIVWRVATLWQWHGTCRITIAKQGLNAALMWPDVCTIWTLIVNVGSSWKKLIMRAQRSFPHRSTVTLQYPTKCCSCEETGLILSWHILDQFIFSRRSFERSNISWKFFRYLLMKKHKLESWHKEPFQWWQTFNMEGLRNQNGNTLFALRDFYSRSCLNKTDSHRLP